MLAPRIVSPLLVLAATCALAGCGKRQVPYHFRSPLVGSVSAPSIERAEWTYITDDQSPSASRPGRALRRQVPDGPAPAKPVRMTIPAAPLAGASGQRLAIKLRDLVGTRDEDATHVEFALAALTAIGAPLDDKVRGLADGPALVALAEDRHALTRAGGENTIASPPKLGDLLVFDNVVDRDPASLVAVVVSVDDREVVEFVYLQRGVGRRGFVAPGAPGKKRDDNGRVLNTFVRGSDGRDPRGTRYLASDLLAATIRLGQLLPGGGDPR